MNGSPVPFPLPCIRVSQRARKWGTKDPASRPEKPMDCRQVTRINLQALKKGYERGRAGEAMGTGRAPEQAWRQERVPGEAELTGQMWGKLGGGGGDANRQRRAEALGGGERGSLLWGACCHASFTFLPGPVVLILQRRALWSREARCLFQGHIAQRQS